MLGETFGNRIKAFKRACSNYAFNAEHCEALDAAIAELDDLLPRRNFIVHGVTYEVGFGDDEPKAYRIGVPKGNIDYLNEFLRHTTSVDHSFPIERVRQATADCKFLASKIGSIVTHLLNLFVASQSKSRD